MPQRTKYSYHENAALAKAFKRAMDDAISRANQSADVFMGKVINALVLFMPDNYPMNTYKDQDELNLSHQIAKI